MTSIVIDTSNAQEHDRDTVTLGANQLLCAHLRLRVRPGRLQRPVFVDELAGFTGAMYEHCAGEDELLNGEAVVEQSVKQTACAAHGDLVVLGTRFAKEIVVGRKMNHRRDTCAVMLMDNPESVSDAVVGCQVHRNGGAACWRRSGAWRSNPTTSSERSANRAITALPIDPLEPVMRTSPFSRVIAAPQDVSQIIHGCHAPYRS